MKGSGRTGTMRAPADLLAEVDEFRRRVTPELDPERRRERGQFLTPLPVARLMASFFGRLPDELYLLDAGAGAGILSASVVARCLAAPRRPRAIAITAFEVEPALVRYLKDTFRRCGERCREAGVVFEGRICEEDFIAYAIEVSRADLFSPAKPRFNAAIANPPYAKINGDSRMRRLLRAAGLETGNLYTAFLALIARLLEAKAELVAITPRSFCNGPYFRPFREEFLARMSLRRIHLFETRDKAFADDEVLQENIITHAVKDGRSRNFVLLSTSRGLESRTIRRRRCPYDDVVSARDPEQVIHLTTDEHQADIRARMERLHSRLPDLSLAVSTGRVVDFRAREFLRRDPGPNTWPLIYPCHFDGGTVAWPKAGGRKPNALARAPATEPLLVPAGVYVLVKRFTSKEEKRRLVACVYDPDRVPGDAVGFENHLDYFHMNGRGMPMPLARGLAAFLNSTPADLYFRQFNGHTQVNAADLKRFAYPSRQKLERLGARLMDRQPDQAELDALIDEEILS